MCLDQKQHSAVGRCFLRQSKVFCDFVLAFRGFFVQIRKVLNSLRTIDLRDEVPSHIITLQVFGKNIKDL